MVVVSNYFLFLVLSESVFFGTLLLIICNLSNLSSVYDRYQLQKHLREMDEKKSALTIWPTSESWWMSGMLSSEADGIFGRTPIDIEAKQNLTQTVFVGAVLLLILECKTLSSPRTYYKIFQNLREHGVTVNWWETFPETCKNPWIRMSVRMTIE